MTKQPTYQWANTGSVAQAFFSTRSLDMEFAVSRLSLTVFKVGTQCLPHSMC